MEAVKAVKEPANSRLGQMDEASLTLQGLRNSLSAAGL